MRTTAEFSMVNSFGLLVMACYLLFSSRIGFVMRQRAVRHQTASYSISLAAAAAWMRNAGGKLAAGPRLLEGRRPPREVVEGDAKADVGHGVGWLAIVVERGGDLGDDDGGAEWDELGFDGDPGEVFDGPDAAGDPAAVADGDDRLVGEREGDENAVDGVLDTPGTEWLYSGVTTR
jgi:hypothetical protein